MEKRFRDNLEIVNEFIEESINHIKNIDKELLFLQQNPNHLDKLKEIKRAFHTIKGVSAFLELTDIEFITFQTEEIIEYFIEKNKDISLQLLDFISDNALLTKECINSLKAKIDGNNVELKKIDREEIKERIKAIMK